MVPETTYFHPLNKIVSPGHTAIVVIDVQNDFCSPGGFFDRRSEMTLVREMMPKLEKFLGVSRELGLRIVYLSMYVDPRHATGPMCERWHRLGVKEDYCVEDTWGGDICENVTPLRVQGCGQCLFAIAGRRNGCGVHGRCRHRTGFGYDAMPDRRRVEAHLIETIDPVGPFGAKGVSEGAQVPVAPAIANAIYDAIGVRMKDMPITPDNILRALEEKRRKQSNDSGSI